LAFASDPDAFFPSTASHVSAGLVDGALALPNIGHVGYDPPGVAWAWTTAAATGLRPMHPPCPRASGIGLRRISAQVEWSNAPHGPAAASAPGCGRAPQGPAVVCSGRTCVKCLPSPRSFPRGAGQVDDGAGPAFELGLVVCVWARSGRRSSPAPSGGARSAGAPRGTRRPRLARCGHGLSQTNVSPPALCRRRVRGHCLSTGH